MKILLIIFTIFTVFLIYGFKNIGDEESGKKQHKISGEELFQMNCAVCHGVDKQGKSPVFPSLVTVNERMNKEQVKELLQTGRQVMPSFAHLSEQEREAIVGYLFGETIETDMVTGVTPEQNGERLFVANCTRCHKATPDDPPPPDQREWGMQPAVLGGITARHSITDFKNILNAGPCYMPSFETLDTKAKEDIYAWLQTMERTNNENFASGGTGCRMRCWNW